MSNSTTQNASVRNFHNRKNAIVELQHAMNNFKKQFPELNHNQEYYQLISNKMTELSAKLTKIQLQLERVQNAKLRSAS